MKHMKNGLCVLLAMILLLTGCGYERSWGQQSYDSNPENVVTILPEDEEEVSSENHTEILEIVEESEKNAEEEANSNEDSIAENPISEDGFYYSKEDVALYIHTYQHLPENFITKDKAAELGWNGGSVEDYAPGMAIGGSRFGNREGLLPQKEGRFYTECDIDTKGASSRGAKRIVFSNDGLIYYTDDHYESFILLYGEAE